MTVDDVWFGFMLGLILGILITRKNAYFSGAIDAYYFAREPKHPGGRKAGRIIYKSLSHMYTDIPNPDED
jgi:hypothetical protein